MDKTFWNIMSVGGLVVSYTYMVNDLSEFLRHKYELAG